MRRGKGRRGVAVLIGFMGAGKSVVGKALAGRLRAGFVDLDEAIEADAGRSIGEIFAAEGEAAFREMERRAVGEAVKAPGRVIAAGGGAFLDEENRLLLSAYAPVVHLDASPETILARLDRDSSRPLLEAGDREGRVRELMAGRRSLYETADHRVATDGRSVGEVVDLVLDRIGRGKAGKR